jgi:hypothetical protein
MARPFLFRAELLNKLQFALDLKLVDAGHNRPRGGLVLASQKIAISHFITANRAANMVASCGE